MAKIIMEGLDAYTKALANLALKAKDQVIGPGVYAGAEIAADAIRERINALPTEDGWGSPQRPLAGPNQVQKSHLQASFGISTMQVSDGYYNVKLGWAGYNPIRTRRWPKGQPNAMVARSVERGTSFMRANPIVKGAISAKRKKIIETMQITVSEKIRAIFENGEMTN